MRENMGLFHGKRKDNGEWVCGDLVHSWEKMNAKPDIQIHNNMGYFDVIPETVGECTSIPDKNGKLIFEGDIVQRDFGEEQIGKQNAIVYYNSKNHAFLLNPVDDWMFTALDDCEVIGNIHDNRELLKGE